MKKYFSFEVQVLDDKNVRRRFRASNYQVGSYCKPVAVTTADDAAALAQLDPAAGPAAMTFTDVSRGCLPGFKALLDKTNLHMQPVLWYTSF